MMTYFAYFKIKFINEIQYKVAAIAGVLTQLAWGAMYIMLYTVFLNQNTTQNSLGISRNVNIYLATTEFIYAF